MKKWLFNIFILIALMVIFIVFTVKETGRAFTPDMSSTLNNIIKTF